MLDNQYHITSNREAGNGRFDIQLLPLNKKLPGILIELKAGKECIEGQLYELAETALKQINDRQYHVEMSAQGVKVIFQYGIAFSGKSASIKVEPEREYSQMFGDNSLVVMDYLETRIADFLIIYA